MGRYKKSPFYWIGILAVVFLTLPLVILAINYSLNFYGIQSPISMFNQPQTQQTPANKVYTLKQPFQINNELSGSPIAGATLNIYTDPKFQPAETLLTDSSGSAISGNSYRSNDRIFVLATKGSSVYGEWITIPIGERETQTTHITKTIKMRLLPAAANVSIMVQDPSGNVISNGGTYNVTTSGNRKPIFTIQVRNMEDNTGFKSFNDPRYGYEWKLMTFLLLQNTGTETGAQYGVITNIPITSQLSPSDKRYSIVIPDDSFSRVKDSAGNYINLGTFSGTIQVDASSLPSGSAFTITIVTVAYTNAQYYTQYSGYGPMAVVLSTYTIHIAA